MTLSGFDVLFYTIVFIVPGYVLHSTITALSSRSRVEAQAAFLRYLTLSAVHNAPYAALSFGMWGNAITSPAELETFMANHTVWTAVVSGIALFVSPFLIAVMYVKARSTVVSSLWQYLRLRPIDPIATAWDWPFEQEWENLYLHVTLKNGDTIYGKFGANSKASTAEAGGDIYLEAVMVPAENGWDIEPNIEGIAIRGDTIATVEFVGQSRTRARKAVASNGKAPGETKAATESTS